ncbi:2-methylcitrate dehydratase [Pilimelia anulata]|uniref:2-methylcitrate dehydratase n=1 Tax=Pilimelia anulata TaxID=53371 RepID=A0A8J3B0E6_9ACTN|nr:MmgE/PrpD family protein [Pilimelia anulata]GGJ80488.1 2-methylcitrate dehydratase [Pilimelia anulata]
MIERPESAPRPDRLAWRLAALAAAPRPVDPAAAELAASRVIDAVGAAVAALRLRPVAVARAQARAHPGSPGASVFGGAAGLRVSPEWAALANGVAVAELDLHDGYPGAEPGHPAGALPALLAVAQHTGAGGADLLRGLLVAYEVQAALATGPHPVDHAALLGTAAACGLGALLGLPTEVTYGAVQQLARAAHPCGALAGAPACAGKVAVELVDRTMRGGIAAPDPSGDALAARLTGDPAGGAAVPLPAPGEPLRGILASRVRAHAVDHRAQAAIDLARRLRPRLPDIDTPAGVGRIASVVLHTDRATHDALGSGMAADPAAPARSLPYVLAVALQDGGWHHTDSTAAERAARADTAALRRRTRTAEDPEWTRRQRSPDPAERTGGGRLEVTFADGGRVTETLAVPDAQPGGARPFDRAAYERKFRTLAEGVVPRDAQRAFLHAAGHLGELRAGELAALFPTVDHEALAATDATLPAGLFR